MQKLKRVIREDLTETWGGVAKSSFVDIWVQALLSRESNSSGLEVRVDLASPRSSKEASETQQCE